MNLRLISRAWKTRKLKFAKSPLAWKLEKRNNKKKLFEIGFNVVLKIDLKEYLSEKY